MVELYQDTLVDLLLPKNAKRPKLDIKKDSKVSVFCIFKSCIRWIHLLYLNSSYMFEVDINSYFLVLGNGSS